MSRQTLPLISPFVIICLQLIAICFSLFSYYIITNGNVLATESDKGPVVKDSHLKVEKVLDGLKLPTSMSFLDANNILVLEKDNGTVRRIVDGHLLKEPLLDVNVANKNERGMLGIATATNEEKDVTYVFLYYTEAKTKDGEDFIEGNEPLGNRLYRYELIDNHLVNPKLLLDLPASPNRHHGGPILIGPDKNVYLAIGDIGQETKTQNFEKGANSTGTGVIFRLSQNGKQVGNILADKPIENKYFAYGIRNSFGMDFDPVSKNLWDTENGLNYGDEINLVEPGFNSGWSKVQGTWESDNHFTDYKSKKRAGYVEDITPWDPEGLVDFGGKGKYRPPEFTWNHSVGPTAVKFLDSKKLGKSYINDLFVGDFLNGNLYHFSLNKNRTGLTLPYPLSDKMANNSKEYDAVIFAHGFGGAQTFSHFDVSGITDIETGPDGFLYILTFRGELYRIVPK
ncbi:MAG TPA: PQQ-dependent sugar dehydrogenase [Nitrososphaeraceae archaeon]|nr:PQQ-dependent sugar dehydrogenase [Nitrososphaeraceae archaeon]